jgi:DNA-binding transcriptional MocR family regulator
MPTLREQSRNELQAMLEELMGKYQEEKARGLSLNMARGKPSPEQLDLSHGLLTGALAQNGQSLLREGAADDLRNYGGLTGIEGARSLMASIMDVESEDVIVCGNSSLNIMYDVISQAMTHGFAGEAPWSKLPEPVTFLCPSPGYDRHFALTEHFGIRMISIPLNSEGPDMYLVERHVRTDKSVKGIWCVPKYSNPTGITYSDDVVWQLASLRPMAPDFRIYWDNAYAVHDLYGSGDKLLSIKTACKETGNEDMWLQFASTSKLTFPGAGISAVASSRANLKEISERLAFQTIGPDKINQLRHVLFLKDIEGVRELMRQHAAILAPKFDCVLRILDEELDGLGVGEWTRPKGGYFISFFGSINTARRAVQLAKDAGVILTSAGATYPYGDDPYDSNIRIAPTYPSIDELEQASRLLALCIKIASIEALLRKKQGGESWE